MINYEADDLIATYAKKITEAGAKVTVISSDKDLMQLVSDKIRLYDPMKSKVIGEKEVIEKFGVKPNQVIDAITNYYRNHNSNILRAVHALAEESTEAFEETRDIVAKFLNIEDSREIVFVRGTTEAINLVAYAWGRDNVKEGDIIVTTEYEHHSNIVPWQLLTQEKKAQLKYIDIDDNGELKTCLLYTSPSPRDS